MQCKSYKISIRLWLGITDLSIKSIYQAAKFTNMDATFHRGFIVYSEIAQIQFNASKTFCSAVVYVTLIRPKISPINEASRRRIRSIYQSSYIFQLYLLNFEYQH